MPVIGFLSSRSADDTARLMAVFRRSLSETGFVEGQNVALEYRWANGHYDQLPMLAAQLARRPVTVIVTTGGEPAALAAKAATSTIPVVFAIGGDPVKLGLAASLNRPDGNATGMSIFAPALEAKRLGLLHELVPSAAAIGFLLNPNFPPAAGQLGDVQEAARAMGLQLNVLRASTDREIDAAFEAIAEQRIGALAVASDPFFDTRRDKILALAARHAVPAMYQFRDYAVAGGLISYGIDLPDVYRRLGNYAGRILKGAKPADLPVMRPTKFEFVVNLKTANALGLAIPPMLLAGADDVIE